MCVVYFILIVYYLYKQTMNKFSRHFYDFLQIIRFVETFVMCYAFFWGVIVIQYFSLGFLPGTKTHSLRRQLMMRHSFFRNNRSPVAVRGEVGFLGGEGDAVPQMGWDGQKRVV